MPTHRPIHDPNLPKPVGPYSPGMGFERLVFVSGQGATDPATGLHRMFQLQTRLMSMRIGMPDGINSVEEECVWSCNRS